MDRPSASTPAVVGIAGGSGSGKTTLARRLAHKLGDQATTLALDWYYRDLSELTFTQRHATNFDHPDSLELDRFARDLATLRRGMPIDAPTYDFATHTRLDVTLHIVPAPVIITEGILLFTLDDIVDACDHRLFIDVPNQVRLERRIRRDIDERGRERADVIRQWNESVAPMYDRFVAPSRRSATQIVTIDDDFDEVIDRLVTKELGYGETV